MSTGRPRTALLFLALLLAAKPVWAVQTHGGSEGLVSHQIGHFLLTVGMGYVLYRLRSMRQRGSGWPEFKAFIWLLIVWNIMTFSGHWMNEFVGEEKFIEGHANALYFTIENPFDAIYYLTRLDHLILVPSFAFLLISLRKWRMA